MCKKWSKSRSRKVRPETSNAGNREATLSVPQGCERVHGTACGAWLRELMGSWVCVFETFQTRSRGLRVSRSDASVGDAEWAEKISVEEFFGATKVLWRARESVVTRCVVASAALAPWCVQTCVRKIYFPSCVLSWWWSERSERHDVMWSQRALGKLSQACECWECPAGMRTDASERARKFPLREVSQRMTMLSCVSRTHVWTWQCVAAKKPWGIVCGINHKLVCVVCCHDDRVADSQCVGNDSQSLHA